MRRGLGWAAAIAVAVGLTAAGVVSASAATQTVAAKSCTATVHIASLAFTPASVTPGQSSTATLKAHNCTGHAQQTTTYWYGRFVGPSAGIPAGCPAVDPLPRPAAFRAHQTITLSTTYRVFPSCTATSFQLTVRIVGPGGKVLATRNATLAIRH